MLRPPPSTRAGKVPAAKTSGDNCARDRTSIASDRCIECRRMGMNFRVSALAVVAVVMASIAQTPRSNVLLVTIDTLRADRVGAYGAKAAVTPTLDVLAREGVRFADAVAHVPLTYPSHVSLLTGRYPGDFGIRSNG